MKRFLKGLGIFFALVAVGIASAFAVVALLLRQEEVRVPDLIGQDIVSVLEVVNQQGLQLKVDRRQPHPAIPRDTVISQTPAPGIGIKKGRLVRVVVSQGPSELLAPKLVGENFRKADIMIRQAAFVPGDISRVASDSVERDLVIAQYPQAGSPLEKGGTITLLVSGGRKAEPLVMPKLTGKRAEEALRIVDRMGLQHRVTARATGDKPTGAERTVIGQKPGAGYPVSVEATVDIIVSK
jgi:eukaryotic-like serine/threonine-protein kinase